MADKRKHHRPADDSDSESDSKLPFKSKLKPDSAILQTLKTLKDSATAAASSSATWFHKRKKKDPLPKPMNLGTAEKESTVEEIDIPSDIDWQMLDKSKFFFLGAAMFFGVFAYLYPAVVLKTRQQVAQSQGEKSTDGDRRDTIGGGGELAVGGKAKRGDGGGDA
ncbi:Uncharacterized protein Fot_18606 [Forsythia ovata]|uniref:Transmembrane protein n=1 Tax=Forsythia ovata TaxID=205694 RepID=A0ABD1VLF9_9LAMI